MKLAELYQTMYLIRESENLIKEHYYENEMKTPMHMSAGGEAISAGICAALQKTDIVYGTFRSHALYLAKTQETDQFFGELFGKTNSMANGKAGSMHLIGPADGHYGSVAIVSGAIPVAVGSAFASAYKKTKQVVAAFFGDGATDEGSFWESLNCACVWQLPMLFVCEDNGLAVHTPKKYRQGYHNIDNIVAQFKCRSYIINTTDVEEIYQKITPIITHVREDSYPAFVHLEYYRYLEHVGVNEDFSAGYRENEMNTWGIKDPLLIARNKLVEQIGVKEVELLESETKTRILNSFTMARQMSNPDPSEVLKDVLFRTA